jgi:hypothetical protein
MTLEDVIHECLKTVIYSGVNPPEDNGEQP